LNFLAFCMHSLAPDLREVAVTVGRLEHRLERAGRGGRGYQQRLLRPTPKQPARIPDNRHASRHTEPQQLSPGSDTLVTIHGCLQLGA
jgi:hypothetical protein